MAGDPPLCVPGLGTVSSRHSCRGRRVGRLARRPRPGEKEAPGWLSEEEEEEEEQCERASRGRNFPPRLISTSATLQLVTVLFRC